MRSSRASHVPYVEGFGTWPFGKEWLWEAIATSYLPLLERLAELERGAGLLSALSIALRTIKSSDGGSAGWPENRFTARSKEPHQALTGVGRARKAARTST